MKQTVYGQFKIFDDLQQVSIHFISGSKILEIVTIHENALIAFVNLL